MRLICAGQGSLTNPYNHIESIIESITEARDENTDAALIYEDLEGFLSNRLNINTASRSQLSRLHLLDDIQIDKLIKYREDYGPVLSIYELGVIDGLNPELLLKIEPFIWFGPAKEEPVKISEMLKYGRHELMLRTQGLLQKPDGYREKEDGSIPFAGDRFRYVTRYRFQSGNDFSAGITAEKDPGEAFFTGPGRYGFDSYSAHLSVKVNNVIKNVTIGDFVVRSGQGLVIWQGFAMGKSIDVLNFSKTNQGIRPFTSTEENSFFRGAATTLQVSDTRLHLFVSRKNRDANIAGSDSTGKYFTSLQSTGYHRTVGEIADKKSIRDFNTGAIVNWQQGSIKLGAVMLYSKFNLPFIPADQLYNNFRFRGEENMAGGFDYLFSKGKYQLFGEAAISKSGGRAAVQGITVYLHDRIQLSSLFRHFDKDYHALWASPFASGSNASNETGLYLGTRILPFSHVVFTAWTDRYRSKWITFNTAGPSQGWDVFSQAEFTPSSRLSIYFRYRNEEKERKFRQEEKNVNLPEQLRKSRLHIQFSLTEKISLKTRFEHADYNGLEKENGFMVFQDIQLAQAEKPLNFSCRIAWYKTDSYNSRIYAYENDVLYAFSIPAYYGNGFRGYLNLKYKLKQNVEMWFKLANYLQNNTKSIGTGYNEITGNYKTELKFQLRLRL